MNTTFKVGDFVRYISKFRDGKIYQVSKVVVKMDSSWIEVRGAFSIFQSKPSRNGEYDPSKFTLVTVEELQIEIDKLLAIQNRMIIAEVMES